MVGAALALVLYTLACGLGPYTGECILLICGLGVGLLGLASVLLLGHLNLLVVDLARVPLGLDLRVEVLPRLSLARPLILRLLLFGGLTRRMGRTVLSLRLLVELDKLLVEIRVFFFYFPGKHRVNLLKLPWEVRKTLIATLQSFNTEGKSVIVILQCLDDKLD